MASAGIPPSATPCRNRPASIASNVGSHGTVTALTAAAVAARRIAARRPTRSDNHAHGSTEMASPNVVAETSRETSDASVDVSRAISVSRPCGAYINENAAKPAHHSAADSRRFFIARTLRTLQLYV